MEKDDKIKQQAASRAEHFKKVLIWAAILIVFCLIAELNSSTAYGKFGESTFFMTVPQRLGWWLMEIPCTVVFIYFFFVKGGPQSSEFVPRLMAAIFLGHYLYRGWIFPFLTRPSSKGGNNFSLLPAVGGWLVTCTHGYLNAKWFCEFGTHLRSKAWLRNPFFIAGLLMYYSGFFMLVWHDKIVRDLRPPLELQDASTPRYKIPHGGFFEYVTAAQYFVELWTWFGFFLLSRGPNGAFIFLVSCVNLIPRAAVTHQWYLQKFGAEYENLDRKILIPGVW